MNPFKHEHLADLNIKLMTECLHETVLQQMVAAGQKSSLFQKKDDVTS